MEITEAELVKQCLAGDHVAWETIVGRYHQRLYNLAYRFSGRFEESQDLAQEIFLKVFRSLNTYKPESGPLITWMVRVGRNHLIDQYRKFKTERTLTDSLEPDYEKAAENPPRYASPMDSLEERELSERIHRALLRIPEDLREAVILRDLEEFTYEEIAETLQVPTGTVKTRMRLALARLREVLGE